MSNKDIVGAQLAAEALKVSAGTRTLVTDLSATFSPGEFVAILGRNGSGKTLTLHTLAGLRLPASGKVSLDGTALAELPRRALARRIGVLLQDPEEGFTTTALESVLIGRHPHLSAWQWEGREDELIARRALAQLDISHCAERRTDTLSGGEQRRVAIAGLLAQEPEVFLVDEPTNHLDPHHQLAVLALFGVLSAGGATVIASLHDPTLAARFANRVLLLLGDGRWRLGATAEVLTAASLSELYSTPMMELAASGRRVFASA
jgi:iron complex transport system ATP-binding protein